MTSGETLLAWLNDAALHVRRQRRLREGAWAVAALVGIVALDALLARFIAVPAVVVALRAMLLLCVVAVVVGAGVRMWRTPASARVAALADENAGLHDELLSAYWFATHREANPFIDAHLDRAVSAARAHPIRQLFPWVAPRKALAMAAVAAVVAVVAWSLPGAERPVLDDGRTVIDGASSAAATGRRVASDATAPEGDVASGRSAAVLWKQLEALAGGFAQRPQGASLAQAVAARDARAAALALQAAKSDDAAPTSETTGANGPGEQMNDVLAKDILERITQLLKEEEAHPPPARSDEGDADRPTARLDRELRADQDDAQRSAPRTQTPGEDALNTSLRALSRSSAGGRDAVHGEADATEGAGRANVGGGAMGRRVGISSAGAGDGDQPVGNIVAPEQGDSVLGRKTERLAVQLQAIKVPQGEAPEHDLDPTGTEEAFYAATRAQAARVTLEAVGEGSRAEAESASDRAFSSVEYREAVKRYTLARHRREPESDRGSGGPR